ncbi:hypothetical protein D3C87_1385140 [compost metagenome]
MRQFRHVAGGGRGLAQLRQLFDDAAAEPGCVLHHRLDRGQQFNFGALALGDVLHDDQQPALSANHHRLGRHQAVQPATVRGGQRGLAVARAFAALQACGHAFIGLQADVGQGLARAGFQRGARDRRKGIVEVQHAQRIAFADGHGHGGQLECLREALFAFAQRRLCSLARFQVNKGEQHAGLVVHVDGLAGDHHELRLTVCQLHHAFALRNGLAFVQIGHRFFFVFAAVQYVEFVGRLAQHGLARVARHFQEALVHFHVAQVG